MSDQPLVSVIIPTYNRAHLIEETLDSVETQTYLNWECIIVDDGSSDNTDEVVGEYVRKDSRFKYYHRPDDHLPGGNGARNYGFKMSKGEYVNWFDSDDLMTNEYLEIKISSFTEGIDLTVSMTGAFENIIGDNNKLWNIFRKDYNKEQLLNDFISQNMPWSTLGALWKRDFLESSNLLWDEKLLIWQDWEFHIKAIIKDCNISFLSILDNFTRISTQNQKISNNKKDEAFFLNLNKVICTTLSLLKGKKVIAIISKQFENLIARVLIRLPTQNGYYFFAFKMAVKYSFKIKSLFPLKSFFFELIKFNPLLKEIFSKEYDKYFKKIKFNTTFMRFTEKDIQT